MARTILEIAAVETVRNGLNRSLTLNGYRRDSHYKAVVRRGSTMLGWMTISDTTIRLTVARHVRIPKELHCRHRQTVDLLEPNSLSKLERWANCLCEAEPTVIERSDA